MTKEQLFTLLGEAEDCYVRDARQEKKRHRWGKWGALAACAALVLIAGRLLLPHGGAQKDPSRPYNVLEFAGAYYEILSVEEDRDILAAYGLPDTIPEEAVGAELGMEPVKLINKIRNNPPQSGIKGPAQRRANVLGVYRVAQPEEVAGKRILLIDDIITTGATAGEAARVLLTAGAEQVHCGVVAAARHHGKQSR